MFKTSEFFCLSTALIPSDLRDMNNDSMANVLVKSARDLDEIEQRMPAEAKADSAEMKGIKTDLRKKGLLHRLENIGNELGNKNSKLRETVSKIENGVEFLQKFGKQYNSVAQWLGLPQVPKIFLGARADSLTSA